jgi:TRAP-type uncharacterized transport system substrate-binding protein
MKLKHTLFVVSAMLALSVYTSAHAELNVATGGPQGTYHAFFVDIKKLCGGAVDLVEVPSKGGDDNLDKLVNKEADLGFVQTDTLKFVGMKNPAVNEADIQTLFPLYNEEVHLIARGAAKTSGGVSIGGFNIGGKTVAVTKLEDLKDMKVGAWGGSITTASAMNVFGNIGMVLVPFTMDKPADAAKAALDKGEIDVILAVGGQPLGFAKTLTPAYRLLEISAAAASKMSFYVPAKLNYSNMNSSVSTIAAKSYLMTRNFRSAGKKGELSALKACMAQNLDEFVEGRGYHPKWKEVSAETPTVWAKFETTPVAAPAPPAPPAPPKRSK